MCLVKASLGIIVDGKLTKSTREAHSTRLYIIKQLSSVFLFIISKYRLMCYPISRSSSRRIAVVYYLANYYPVAFSPFPLDVKGFVLQYVYYKDIRDITTAIFINSEETNLERKSGPEKWFFFKKKELRSESEFKKNTDSLIDTYYFIPEYRSGLQAYGYRANAHNV
ncbi:hypothetical protein ACJX0J_010874 [Zea mays]